MSDTRTITATEAKQSLIKCFKKKRPIFLWGPPGIGKSDLVDQVTTELGGKVFDLRLAQMDPTDLRGIPYYNKAKNLMDWAPPIDLPDEAEAKKWPIIVLFLDEMNSAAPAVQAAAYQLILNRRVGKYHLPENVVMCAAGNRESDKGVTYRMPTPLANRFVHQEMRVDFDSWEGWAVRNHVHKDIVGYLSGAKQDLYDFDPKSASRSFATPRSWVFTSELIEDEDKTDKNTTLNLVAGAIGEGLAVKFMAHRKVASKMPKPQDILDGTVKDLAIKDISAMYSLVVSLCYELKDRKEHGGTGKKADATFHKNVDNFFQYMMDNFDTEIVVMGARTALTTYDLKFSATKLKTFDKFHEKFGKYILKASQSSS